MGKYHISAVDYLDNGKRAEAHENLYRLAHGDGKYGAEAFGNLYRPMMFSVEVT